MSEHTRKTILLVEDEALIAMNEAAVLKRHGFEVLTAYNAEQAVKTAREKEIDLVLMDIDLGRGKPDGTSAAESILQFEDIPVIFLSSHTGPEVVEKTEKITSYGYVVKNSGDTVLLTSIKMAFRLHKSRMHLKQEEEERNRLISELQKRVKELNCLYRFSDLVERSNTLEQIFEGVTALIPPSWQYPENVSAKITYKDTVFTSVMFEARQTVAEQQAVIAKGDRQFTEVVENMPVMLDAFDETNNILFWNKECERITGYTSQEMSEAERPTELLYPDAAYREHVFRELAERGGNFRGLELELTCKNGSKRTVSWYNIAEIVPVEGWATWAVGIDITEQKQAKG